MSLPAQTMAVSTEKPSTKEKEAIQAVLPLAELILEPGPPWCGARAFDICVVRL